MTHNSEKNGLCYATANILQCGRKNKGAVECAVEQDSRTENRKSPMQQDLTKTQNCTKVADTTNS